VYESSSGTLFSLLSTGRCSSAFRFAYTLALAYLLTAATYHPASLRGIAKWTLALVTKGGLKYGKPPPSQNGRPALKNTENGTMPLTNKNTSN
jgi:hypothetical protein